MEIWDVAVVGAGPAGLTVAHRLAEGGWSVVVLDPQVPFEKPCGGGLTPRVWDYIPVPPERFATRRAIERVVLESPEGKRRALELPRPISVVSRWELGLRLLEAVQAVGGEFRPRRVTDARENGKGWSLSLDDGTCIRANWVVFADGVYGISRRLFGHLPATGWTRTVGYLIPGTTDVIFIRFWRGWDGYGWVFPRADATSVGLCDGVPGQSVHLFQWLDTWARSIGWVPETAIQRYGYLIPSPRRIRPWCPLWGERWARVGDASGFVDPITREGIFFALQGGWALADCIRNGAFPRRWAEWIETQWWPEWRAATRWRAWFYRPWFLKAVFTAVRWGRFERILQQVLVGAVSYRVLLRRLL